MASSIEVGYSKWVSQSCDRGGERVSCYADVSRSGVSYTVACVKEPGQTAMRVIRVSV